MSTPTSNFNIENINNILSKVSKESMISYESLPQYSLFLSQVIDYLNDKFKGEDYTTNIVQNYMKNEVISRPKDGKKRGYTNENIIQLLLLSNMRPILTTDEIKKVFNLAFNDINDRSDDIISWETAFKLFTEIQSDSFDKFFSNYNFDLENLKNIIEETNVKTEDEERILVFLIVMTLIAQASVIKRVVHEIVTEYNK